MDIIGATQQPLSPAVDSRLNRGSVKSAPTGGAKVADGRQAPVVADSRVPSVPPAVIRGGSRVRLDEATDRVVVQILNRDHEVIKQLPPEDLLKAILRFREITGLLFDEQA